MIYYNLIFSLLIAILSAGGGWYIEHLRYDALEAEYQVFKDQVATKGEIAQEQVKTEVVEQKSITQGVVSNEKAKLALVDSYYAGLRLKAPGDTGSSSVPQVSISSRGVDGIPKDTISIEHDCASETVKLMALQDWIRQQSEIK